MPVIVIISVVIG